LLQLWVGYTEHCAGADPVVQLLDLEVAGYQVFHTAKGVLVYKADVGGIELVLADAQAGTFPAFVELVDEPVTGILGFWDDRDPP